MTKLESDVYEIRFLNWVIVICLVFIVIHVIVLDVWLYMAMDALSKLNVDGR